MMQTSLQSPRERCSIAAMEQMRITSVNVGRRERIRHGRREFKTGINKRSVEHGVMITAAGVNDDAICDTDHHGGPDQAVYAYSMNDYEWWSEQLGRKLLPGTFGDNLTVAGLPVDMNAGDRLLIGEVILEATAPRIPCSTLAAQMQDSRFGLTFKRAERPGFYFRVLNGGEMAAGDAVTLAENPQQSISMLELFRLSYQPRPAKEDLDRAVNAPISIRMRDNFESKLLAIAG